MSGLSGNGEIERLTPRDELRQITKNSNQRRLDEQKERELVTLEEWKKDEYWGLCEKLWPKLYESMKYSAREGSNHYTYCVTYKDFKDTMPELTVYSEHIRKLRSCLVSFARFKGFSAREENVWGHNNGGHLEIRW